MISKIRDRGKPEKRWIKIIREDMGACRMDRDIVRDTKSWKRKT